MLFSAVFVLASCLSTDDNYTYTDDSAITSFSITSGKKYSYVKSSTGEDSLVTSDITLSSYKFYIDQADSVIYNPDSLPCGVDARKLLCSVSSLNSGTVVIKSATSDTLQFVSSTDSIDFSVDRQLQVYSNSGLAVRKYTVKVNVHKEQPDSFAWHAVPACEALKELSGVRTAATDGGILLFGTDGEKTVVFRGGDSGWTYCPPDFNHTLAADAYKGVVVKDGLAYVSDGGTIMCTTDGEHWAVTGTATAITRLVAASRFRLYGYATDGRFMASADNGKTWSAATTDEDVTLLPTDETAYVAVPVKTNSLTDRVLLFGTRDKALYPGDKTLTVWGRIDEGAEGSESQPWSYYDVAAENTHKAPLLSCISAVAYDDAVFVLGSKDDAKPALYKTLDNGITWNADTTLTIPDDFGESLPASGGYKAFSITADKNNVLWLVNARNGMAWRGRINRLGWKKEQTEFNK